MNNITSAPTAYNFGSEVNKATRYIWPVVIVLVTLTNTINIAVFCRPNLRTSACSHYFLALAVGNLLYMCFTPLQLFVNSLFSVTLNSSPIGCRISQFCIFSPALLATTMLVCSSIDRFCSSSSSVQLRHFSDVRTARRVIIIVSIVIVIYMSPFFFISYWDYNRNVCSQYSTTLTNVYLASRVFLYYIVEPLIMTIFGLLTIHSIRSRTSRVVPLAALNRRRRIENQLTAVLLFQVGMYLIFSLPTAVIYMIPLFTPSITTPLFTGIRTLSIIWFQVIFFLSFFLYILSASVFRKEFLQMFRLYRENSQVYPNSHATVRTNYINNTRV